MALDSIGNGGSTNLYANNSGTSVKNGDQTITVTMKGTTPEAHADAIIKHFGMSKADEQAFKDKNGYDLREFFTKSFAAKDNKQAHQSIGNGYFKVLIPISKQVISQIKAVKNISLPILPTKTPASNANPNYTIAGQTGIDRSSQIRAGLQNKLPVQNTANVGNKDVSQMGLFEKLQIILGKTLEHLGPEAAEKFKQLLSPENIAIMVGTTAALIAVQGVPFLDVAVDAAVLGLAVYSLGSEAIGVIGDLVDFATKTAGAKTEADLDAAAKSLAKATATVGVDGLAALLIHKGVKSIKGGEIPPPNSRVVEMVTPEGFRVKVRVPVEEPTNTKGSNVLESRSENPTSAGKIKPEAGTPEHKTLRWQEYETKNAGNTKKLSYETWSKIYDVNMQQANKSNVAVKAYQQKLGWGKTEVTVEVEPGVNRRLDIADVKAKKAVEHKTGYTSLDEDIKWEVTRDKKLVEQGWKITWHFEGTASKPLIEALKIAGITVTYGK